MAGQNVTAVYDRVKETTATTGTGPVSLAGAVTGFVGFGDVFTDTDTTYYCLISGNDTDWEIGVGTWASSGDQLARTTVLANSAGSTAKISLTGTSTVFVNYPAAESIHGQNHRAKLTQTSSQTVSDATFTTITFEASEFTAVGCVASTAANTITVKRAGIYLIRCQCSGDDDAGGDIECYLMPTVNGTAIGDTVAMHFQQIASSDDNIYLSMSVVQSLAVDDVVRLCVWMDGSMMGGGIPTIVSDVRKRPCLSVTELR